LISGKTASPSTILSILKILSENRLCPSRWACKMLSRNGFRRQRCRQGCGILPADMETLLGAIVILRQVEFDGTNWIYRIEKSGTEYTKKLQ
jgi:hypothetical protein